MFCHYMSHAMKEDIINTSHLNIETQKCIFYQWQGRRLLRFKNISKWLNANKLQIKEKVVQVTNPVGLQLTIREQILKTRSGQYYIEDKWTTLVGITRFGLTIPLKRHRSEYRWRCGAANPAKIYLTRNDICSWQMRWIIFYQFT
jgi:hypothetical protein